MALLLPGTLVELALPWVEAPGPSGPGRRTTGPAQEPALAPKGELLPWTSPARGKPLDPIVAPAAPADDVRAAVIETICAVTGYPADLIVEGADLEADLGVDSIRKMELLGALEKRFGFRTADSDYAKLASSDLGALVAHVQQRTAAARESAPVGPVAGRSPGARLAVLVRQALPPEAARRRAPRGEVVWLEEGVDPEAAVELLVARALPDPLTAVLPDDAGGDAATSWLRSAAKELGRELVVLRPQGIVSRERLLAELASAPPGVRWLDADGAGEDRPLAVVPAVETSWPERPVVLATGGFRGILGPCLRALPGWPIVVLLARSEGTLEGLEVHGVPGDVTIRADVARAAAFARERFGRIDLVVHAAGALRDGPIGRGSAEDRREVFGPKWLGATHLAEETRRDALIAFCTFSSLVAHAGNAAQTTYAAANAAMERVVHPTARTLSLAWTAWSEVGMAAAPALQDLLRSRGVRPISPAEGAAAFRAALDSGLSGPVLVTADPLPNEVVPRWPLGSASRCGRDRVTLAVPLDPSSAPLADHRVAGRPLVPAAMWLAAIVEAAGLATGGERRLAVAGLDILAPTFVSARRDDVSVDLVRRGDGWDAVIRAGSEVVCRARVSLAGPVSEAVAPPVPLSDPEEASQLYRPDLLFHGPAWQVLQRVRWTTGTATADLGPGLDGLSSVASAVDGAHQLLAAWSGRSLGWLGLPVGADLWIADASPSRIVRLETVASGAGRELRARVVGRDQAGRVVLSGEGVCLRAARREEPDA